MTAAFTAHWPEYLMEAGALAAFMIAACVCSVLLDYEGSPVHQAIDSALVRRVLTGLAMGGTLVGIVYSPWGQRSGAHMNPAVTLTFLTLGRVERWDAIFYVLAQFAGGGIGVGIADLLIGLPLRHSSVNYVATVPGPGGPAVAFAGEFAISLIMMATILTVSNSRRLSRLTPWCAGALLATFIIVEAPVSGVSLNPARTAGSAIFAGEWPAWWVYFTAPAAAMLLAGQLHRMRGGAHRVFCAKLHHHNSQRCIFRCNFDAM